MSHFQCPVCGKHTSIRNFDPEGFDEVIDIIQATGLGRGRGFSNDVIGTIDDDPELKAKLLARVTEVQRVLSQP